MRIRVGGAGRKENDILSGLIDERKCKEASQNRSDKLKGLMPQFLKVPLHRV